MDDTDRQVARRAGLRPARADALIGRLAAAAGIEVARVAKPNAVCQHCGSGSAAHFAALTKPDFDTRVLPPPLRRIFVDRAIGMCRNCGLTQDYLRYDRASLHAYCEILSDKDMAVSEEAFHSFPVPAEYVADFEARYVGQRVKRWIETLDAQGIAPQRALFLRPVFGGSMAAINARYGTACDALDISTIARRTSQERFPQFRYLDGSIHALFEGRFLEEGGYDVIFCFHTLTHSIDVHSMLAHIHRMLRPGGIALFAHEVTVKPSNPFHMLFMDEAHLCMLLARHFDDIGRIGETEKGPSPTITPYTADGKVADYYAVKS